MKYRIKDQNLRQALGSLFGEEFDLELSQSTAEISLRVPDKIMHPYTAEIELEPIQELAEGWNLYPKMKPEKDGLYLCAIHLNQQDTVVGATYDKYNGFRSWDSDIFAWQELPEIWKE